MDPNGFHTTNQERYPNMLPSRELQPVHNMHSGHPHTDSFGNGCKDSTHWEPKETSQPPLQKPNGIYCAMYKRAPKKQHFIMVKEAQMNAAAGVAAARIQQTACEGTQPAVHVTYIT